MNNYGLRTVRSIVLVLMLNLFGSLPAFSKEQAPHVGNARQFFVATTGRDTNPGTESRPFATLQRARDAVRKMKAANGLEQPVTIFVRGGKYFFRETFRLREEDSGT